MKIKKVLEKHPNEGRAPGYTVDLVELEDGGKGIWKTDIKTYKPTIVALKEIIAYRIDQWLGLNVIPETVFCECEGRPGSLQRFIEGVSGTEALKGEGKPPVDLKWAQRLGMYDYIANNCDRWPCNIIVESNGRLWGIDNAGILQARDAWTASSWAITGVPLPEDLKAVVFKTRENMSGLVKMAFDVEINSWHGKVTGRVFDVGLHIMCEKITCIAGALGYEQSLSDSWGSPNWAALKNEIGE